MLTLLDETGVNPLPAGILVSVVDGSGNAVRSGYTTAGGSVAISVTAELSYTAYFNGANGRAPAQPQAFVGGTSDPTTVIVAPYQSPSLSTEGYANAQADVFPVRRASSAALAPGGGAYALESALGAMFSELDQEQVQVTIGAERLQSSQGDAVDLWVNDFLGAGTWPRGTSESDAAYIARTELWLKTPFTTLYGIQTLVTSFLEAYAIPQELAGPLALDEKGAIDLSGSLDGGVSANPQPNIPTVIVFDWQSNPTLAEQVPLAQDEGQFCILFVYGTLSETTSWFLGQSFIGVDSFLASNTLYTGNPPFNGLDPLVKRIMAAGKWPIYASNQPLATE